ncbi:precorrin-6x reductase [Synechococcus sp. PCC 7335]|uniref:precorrin-6A/cobalt-precorrin-6A reductase n=1 Tax=Synechococcus sp. (strain ATCC 29403 / PCC 7335) TaxID=91464 RepID=UPI00017EDD23|nr:precorrin-6A/cobalt-precorrin-6A reductase [Synechococcus sp. PCC 7335]EDX86637.1 precorrin-6x reductase [Synechococcus sp. PCC 7335]
MPAHVWLVGGTSESAALASALSELDVPYVVTVTTEAAKQLYLDTAKVWVGQLSAHSIDAFIERWQVRCILDASHPFALEISRLAIKATNQATDSSVAISYLRYERPEVDRQSSTDQGLFDRGNSNQKNIETNRADSPITSVSSLSELLDSGVLQHQRVLFTLGYRQLTQLTSRLAHLRQTSQLFVRVLPSIKALSAVLAAGFSSQEIMAIKPPVSPALERALWQQWQISVIVAKASGIAGGEAVKRAIALELGKRLILIERPSIIYPKQTNLISEAIEFCSKTLRLY